MDVHEYRRYSGIFGGTLPPGFEDDHRQRLRFWHNFRSGPLDTAIEFQLLLDYREHIPRYFGLGEGENVFERNGGIVQGEAPPPPPEKPKKSIFDLEAGEDHVMVFIPGKGPKRGQFLGMFGPKRVRVGFENDKQNYRLFSIDEIELEDVASG